MEYYSHLTEDEKRKISRDTLQEQIFANRIVALKGAQRSVLVGEGLGLRYNASVGLNTPSGYDGEIKKICTLHTHKHCPDIMMDLSTIKIQHPLYLDIQEILGCPVGTIPYYSCFYREKGIEKNELLERIQEQAENGVSFFTLHLTANLDMAAQTLWRTVPIISRGGSLLLRDMKVNHRKDNILMENIDEILAICKQHNIVISIGTTFRPSTLQDALDEVNKKEIKRQLELCKWLQARGIHTIMEGIGHIPYQRIPEYVSIIRADTYIPFMPLGPIVSDRTQGYDHITNAVGASYIAGLGGADIINAVTREEHTGGIPTETSFLEAIDGAATVVKIVNDSRFFDQNEKPHNLVHNCMGIPDVCGCSRCNYECPFIWNDEQRLFL